LTQARAGVCSTELRFFCAGAGGDARTKKIESVAMNRNAGAATVRNVVRDSIFRIQAQAGWIGAASFAVSIR